MKKIIITTFSLVWMLSSMVRANELRIGVEGAYPPFSQTNADGSISGFDIDIAEALCSVMQVKCKLIKQDWDGMIPALLARKYDAIIASMTITEKRKKKVAFTNKYYAAPAVFVVPKKANYSITNSELKGKTVAVQKETVMSKFIIHNYGAFGILRVRSYDTQDQANLDLASDRTDLGFMEVTVAEAFLKSKSGRNFKAIGPTFGQPQWFGEGIGIAVRKNSHSLRENLNQAIATIRKNGTYDTIRRQYFANDIYGD